MATWLRCWCLCVVVVFVAISPSLSMATPPGERPADANTPGSSFIPEGGYLQNVRKNLMKRRSLAVQPGGIASAPGADLSISGTPVIPVICVEFSNRPHKFSTQEYQQVLFDPAGPPPSPPRPTLTQYYRDISNGNFVPAGNVMGWYKLPKEDSFYESDNNGRNERLSELLKFAFTQADNAVDFGQFDNDGSDRVPNSGDDDGLVDAVFLIHSERGGEAGNSNIWSHSFVYSKFMGTGGPFITGDVQKNELGEPKLGPDGVTPLRILIDDYTIQPGLAAGGMDRITPIGVFCHEYGHALGLPDLYDRTPATPKPDSRGIGSYCLMAEGCNGADGNSPETPVHMSAWCKALLGWAIVQPLTFDGSIVFEPVQQRNLVYNIDVPGTNGKEYFLIEYRASTWSDQFGERLNWDKGIAAEGLAIWHVDDNVGRGFPTWPFTEEDKGQNDAPSMPTMSTTASFPEGHSLVALVQADGKLHLERNANRATFPDAGDLFATGSVFSDDPGCVKGSRGYNSQCSGVSLTDINLATRRATIRLRDFPAGTSAAVLVAAQPRAVRAAVVRSPISAAAPPAPAPPPTAVSELRALEAVGAKVMRRGIDALDSSDKARLGKTSLQKLRQSITQQALPKVMQIAAAERTKSIGKLSQVTSNVENTVKQLVEASTSLQDAKVRFDSTAQRVERITGLQIPTEGKTPREDAASRVQTQFRELFGEATQLRPVAEGDGITGPVEYAQVVKVGDKEIQLHCSHVKIYYKDQKLTAIDAHLVPVENLKVSGTPGGLTDEQARRVIEERLGISPKVVRRSEECLYLVNGDPAKARVAVQVNVESGGKRKPIEVLVDSETKEILEIR